MVVASGEGKFVFDLDAPFENVRQMWCGMPAISAVSWWTGPHSTPSWVVSS